MRRRDLFKLAGSSALLASSSAAVSLAAGCQREAPKTDSFVHPLRAAALPDSVEPAFAFRPLPRRE